MVPLRGSFSGQAWLQSKVSSRGLGARLQDLGLRLELRLISSSSSPEHDHNFTPYPPLHRELWVLSIHLRPDATVERTIVSNPTM